MRRLQVKVRPRSGASVLVPPQDPDGIWTAQLKSPPVDGKANDELIALLARHFGCARGEVRIKVGQSARLKLVEVPDAP